MSKKHTKVCKTLNKTSNVNGYVSIFAFDFLVGIPVGIVTFAVGMKFCALTPV